MDQGAPTRRLVKEINHMTHEQQIETAFRQGYYLAVANLMRMHDQEAMAVDVLRQIEPSGRANWKGIDLYDRKTLTPVFKELRRRKVH
jgi:hypothetical protein